MRGREGAGDRVQPRCPPQARTTIDAKRLSSNPLHHRPRCERSANEFRRTQSYRLRAAPWCLLSSFTSEAPPWLRVATPAIAAGSKRQHTDTKTSTRGFHSRTINPSPRITAHARRKIHETNNRRKGGHLTTVAELAPLAAPPAAPSPTPACPPTSRSREPGNPHSRKHKRLHGYGPWQTSRNDRHTAAPVARERASSSVHASVRTSADSIRRMGGSGGGVWPSSPVSPPFAPARLLAPVAGGRGGGWLSW